MENMNHMHGGDLDAIERKYHIKKEEIMDFSGNINPLGFPKSVAEKLAENIALVSIYPDKDYCVLKKSIGEYTGADPKNIVVGNGSTELISGFIKAIAPKNAVILGPAYSEYENEVSISGGKYIYFPLEEKDGFIINPEKLKSTITNDTDIFIACNPNNPTGTAIKTETMREILAHAKKTGTVVMIDETYIEFSENLDELTSIPLVNEFDNLFVIRGISKFFAAPGLRLGYGISSNRDLMSKLSMAKDPWSVNILASFAGEHLYKDKKFINETKALIFSERKKALAELLSWKNIRVYPSSSNFILIKLITGKVKSCEVFEKLIVKKMLIRNAASFTFLDESFLRFCLLLPEQNAMLLSEMKKIIED
ncbi:MAG: histidinol-phosphate transaminase [Lachnospiraceae bacterium]|nr:histidinol-phosphate transaminase [Lachnospiraceae bacterium]